MKRSLVDALVDVHCHLLPYVDDGAQNLEQALELLRLQAQQGVGTCFLTVHQRSGMFETPQEKVDEKFAMLREAAARIPGAPRLFLGRENHVDKAFLSLLREGRAQTLGGSPYMLLEFSHNDPEELFLKAISLVEGKGYIPVIAHIERCRVFHQKESFAQELSERGAMLQINAGSVLGKEGLRQKLFCHSLLKADRVDLIASDSHRTEVRTPNLGDCAARLKRRLPAPQWERIFYQIPGQIVAQTKIETFV